tara:strand:+ start:1056 stop:1358 length:303 start_codon:yes stop_codon:yes gene_type:complete
LNKVAVVILPLSLSVTREGKEGIKGRSEGKERRSNGNKESEERTPSNKDTNKESMRTPIQKPQKISLAPQEQHPPLLKINHFGFAKFLRVAIYNPITQHI